MKTSAMFLIAVGSVCVIGLLAYSVVVKNDQDGDPTSPPDSTDMSDLIQVTEPSVNATVTSPLTVTGNARGSWYFEASFPITVLDANGKKIGQGAAQALDEWMTIDLVPFSANITFTPSSTGTGTLLLENDNPSGLPENAKELRIPIVFSTATRTVTLYYYDASKDKDAQGNILCSSQGLVPIERTIPRTISPIHDTINLLLAGQLSEEENAQSITTEYPLAGFTLQGANLRDDGNLTLAFADPENKTTGGS